MIRFPVFLFSLFLLLFLSCKQQKEPAYYSYVDALDQLHGIAIREEGLTAKGVKVGVVDLGFATLNSSAVTRHLMNESQLAFCRQYYPDSQAVFFNHTENHGMLVTFMMAGKSKRDSVYGGGLAINATLYLAKIGRSAIDTRSFADEEENIRRALDDFYNRGVRVVNMSLGYWDDFEEPELNYTPAQMDGKTSRIARICQEYVNRGMILVAAAGNAGEFAWRTVWTPADVEGVITVGAVSSVKQPFRASYSGIGNAKAGFIKPDVVCYSSGGTSVSTPVITSLVATMLEKDNSLTPARVQTILHKASCLYPYPNNYIGYGVPDCEKVLKLIDDPTLELSDVKEVYVVTDQVKIPSSSENIMLFQKISPTIVKRQYHITPEEGMVVLKRRNGIPRSTLVIDNCRVFEIFWK
ncbi:MAG: S8 family serine peptidase [Bacteroidetes bacterium]|nr:S8 family serine peptidase [Bacteroidota bacterium]